MSEDIRRTRKSKMEDGDMGVGSREWGKETEPEIRREREKGKVGAKSWTEGKKRGKRVRVTERM